MPLKSSFLSKKKRIQTFRFLQTASGASEFVQSFFNHRIGVGFEPVSTTGTQKEEEPWGIENRKQKKKKKILEPFFTMKKVADRLHIPVKGSLIGFCPGGA